MLLFFVFTRGRGFQADVFDDLSPFGLSVGPLEDVVSAVEVHDPVLQVELPFVPGSSDLLVLANHNLEKQQFNFRLRQENVQQGFEGNNLQLSRMQICNDIETMQDKFEAK